MIFKTASRAGLWIVFAGLLAVACLAGNADVGQAAGEAGGRSIVLASQCSHNDHIAANGCCVPNHGSACREGFHQSAKEACACVADAGSKKPPCSADQRRGPDGVCFSCSHNDHFDASGTCVPCPPGQHVEGDSCVADGGATTKTPEQAPASQSEACVTGGPNASQQLTCAPPFDTVSCSAQDANGNATCCCVNQQGKTQ